MPERKSLWQNWTFWSTPRYDAYRRPGGHIPSVQYLEVLPDDPNIDRLVEAAVNVLKASHHGDQYFKQYLGVPEAAELRTALVKLRDVFREDLDDEGEDV